jgi:hypothetical protein
VTHDELVELLGRQALVTLEGDELPALLDASETVRAVDTCLAGMIRILAFDGRVLVQEQTPEGEVLVRRMPSDDAAERFLEHRLAAYERMWDGCGCKIDYHAGPEAD